MRSTCNHVNCLCLRCLDHSGDDHSRWRSLPQWNCYASHLGRRCVRHFSASVRHCVRHFNVFVLIYNQSTTNPRLAVPNDLPQVTCTRSAWMDTSVFGIKTSSMTCSRLARRTRRCNLSRMENFSLEKVPGKYHEIFFDVSEGSRWRRWALSLCRQL